MLSGEGVQAEREGSQGEASGGRCGGHSMTVVRDEQGGAAGGSLLLLYGGQDQEEQPLGQMHLLKGQLHLL